MNGWPRAARLPETRLTPTPTIAFAKSRDDLVGVSEMMRRYLDWDLAEFERLSGIRLDVGTYLANTFDRIEDHLPPDGRLAMARDQDGALLGMALLKPLGPASCEIKRMFVDPAARGGGLGRQLLAALLAEARAIGYREAFLDSAPYMAAAHRLYRAFGFEPAETYPGGENDDPALARHLVFMRLAL